MSGAALKVVADQDLAGIDALAGKGFELTLLPGREITSTSLRGHDALLVRSITRVDRMLLDGSDIAFVGTATSGLDHIDQKYLASHGIRLAHAAGSNAEAVADYCLSAMALLDEFARPVPPVVGIVGCGQVGSRLYRRLSAMGLRVRLCDPLLASQLSSTEQDLFSSLAELGECDVLSLHVPLTATGDYPTRGMIDAAFLELMSPDALLINTSRGGVVDESALLSRFESGQAPRCAFDVWEREPAVNPALVTAVDVATPHIAGYSSRAKSLATDMVVCQLREFAGKPLMGADVSSQSIAKPSAGLRCVSGDYPANAAALAAHIRSAFDLATLSERFKKAVGEAGEGGVTAAVFDGFRSELRERIEFSGIKPGAGMNEPESRFLHGAGFAVDTGS